MPYPIVILQFLVITDLGKIKTIQNEQYRFILKVPKSTPLPFKAEMSSIPMS